MKNKKKKRIALDNVGPIVLNNGKYQGDILDRTDRAVGELSYDVRTEIPVPESPVPRYCDELGFFDELLKRSIEHDR